MTPRHTPSRKGFRVRSTKGYRQPSDIIQHIAARVSKMVDDVDDTCSITVPAWADDVQCIATSLDRLFFDENPDTPFYTRPAVVGEFWPVVYPVDTVVIVSRIPGRAVTTRVRLPCPPRHVRQVDREAIMEVAGGGGTALLIDFNKRPAFKKNRQQYLVVDADPDDGPDGANWGR